MTIALGILANDGIVLAADTELSWGEARKSEGAKIAVLREAGLAIAGAGSAGIIDALSYELQVTIARTTSGRISDVGRAIQAVLSKFYREHILPWKDPNFDVELLIALERNRKRVLWVTHRTTLRPCVCATIGVGSVEADDLFGQLFGTQKSPDISVAAAMSIATYAAHVAKDRIPGCGKNTDMVVVAEGKAEQLHRQTVLMLEDNVENLLALQMRVAQFALGYIDASNGEDAEYAKYLASFFVKSREDFEQMRHLRMAGMRWVIGPTPDARYDLTGPEFVADPLPTPLAHAGDTKQPTGGRRVRQGSRRGRKRQPPSPE